MALCHRHKRHSEWVVTFMHSLFSRGMVTTLFLSRQPCHAQNCETETQSKSPGGSVASFELHNQVGHFPDNITSPATIARSRNGQQLLFRMDIEYSWECSLVGWRSIYLTSRATPGPQSWQAVRNHKLISARSVPHDSQEYENPSVQNFEGCWKSRRECQNGDGRLIGKPEW